VFLTLRLIHILTGVFWAGTVFFMVSFLIPSMTAAGPGARPVQAEFAKRNLFVKLPIIGLLTILSGFTMYYLRMQGSSSFAPTNEARVLGVGGVAALVALIFGATFVRPNQARAMELGMKAGPLPPGAEKDALMAQVAALGGKVAMGARVVATLLGIAVITMAVARYV
jgi:hypothetical protein